MSMPSPELIWSIATSNQTKRQSNYIKQVAKRMESGKKLYESGNVQKLEDKLYIVKSASDESVFYTVEGDECTCLDHINRGVSFKCKHRWSISFYEGIEK